MRRTPRARKTSRRVKKNRRVPEVPTGGSVETVAQVILATPTEPELVILNQNSKFVVATYWWGRANQNRNLQYPCPEDVMEIAKERTLAFFWPTNRFPILLKQNIDKLKLIRGRTDTPFEASIRASVKSELLAWKERILSTDEGKRKLKEFYDQAQAEEQAKPGSRPIRGFAEMIEEWKQTCRAANVNYISLNTEFDRTDYQNGINGKPLFIKKILDAVAPRAVLYIDGDMWIKKYPHIFDIDGVDFMARGWNIDCRTKQKSMARPYYDPYTFETSGGTMYFGNTKKARDLLDMWHEASGKPEAIGKADDRILSMLFTSRSLVVDTNIIQLPIEYLWLTDNYKDFLNSPQAPASIEDAIIEHPYCLTGEERAAGQGAAVSRLPVDYEYIVEDNISYKRELETFYEYIYFDGNQQVRDEFGRFLTYIKSAKNSWMENRPLLNIVDFANTYGEFTPIATRNLEGLVATANAQPTKVSLPLTATIRDILTALLAGNDVEVGADSGTVAGVGPEDEFVGFDASTPQDGVDMYTRRIHVDTTKPMFMSGKNHMIRHLLAMCETLADINKHARSYMFLSRIRWNLVKPDDAPSAAATAPATATGVAVAATATGVAARPPPTIAEGIDFRPVVHQIWFGGDMPEWRKKMFAYNKSVAEAAGFTHKIWRNEDRNRENFPQTIAYQDAAIAAGQETGQSRWAQVADLARLEIIYNSSGIYIDSLFEITPAFLMGILNAIQEGYTFVGCNEDQCVPPLDCQNSRGEKYLTNSFFAATRAHPIFERLLSEEKLDNIDMENPEINHETGPYFLHSGIRPEEDNIFLFDSGQVYQFNQQETPYKPPNPNRFLFRTEVPGSIKVNDNMYFLQGGIDILQAEFLVAQKGPLATYHSGLGGTWST